MRFRITQITTVEFDVDPTNYSDDGGLTPEQMLEIDLDNLREDPAMIFLIVNEEDEETILTGEIIQEENGNG